MMQGRGSGLGPSERKNARGGGGGPPKACYSGLTTTFALAFSVFSMRFISALISRICFQVRGGEAISVWVSSNGSGKAPIEPLYLHGSEPASGTRKGR